MCLHAKQMGSSKILFPIKRLLYLGLTRSTTTMISNDNNNHTHDNDVDGNTLFIAHTATTKCHDERAIIA